jgi:hypothetical protein
MSLFVSFLLCFAWECIMQSYSSVTLCSSSVIPAHSLMLLYKMLILHQNFSNFVLCLDQAVFQTLNRFVWKLKIHCHVRGKFPLSCFTRRKTALSSCSNWNNNLTFVKFYSQEVISLYILKHCSFLRIREVLSSVLLLNNFLSKICGSYFP